MAKHNSYCLLFCRLIQAGRSGSIALSGVGLGRRVTAHASLSPKGSDQKHPVHKMKLLALKWAIMKNSRTIFIFQSLRLSWIATPLNYLMPIPKLDATGHHWVTVIFGDDFSVYYLPGRQNVAADFLAWLPHEQCSPLEL